MKLTNDHQAFAYNRHVAFGTKIKFEERNNDDLLRRREDNRVKKIGFNDCRPEFIKGDNLFTEELDICHGGILIAENGDTYMFHNAPTMEMGDSYYGKLNDKPNYGFGFPDLPKIRKAIIIGGKQALDNMRASDSIMLADNLAEILKTKFGVKNITRISDFARGYLDLFYSKDKDELIVYNWPREKHSGNIERLDTPRNENELKHTFNVVDISEEDELVFEDKKVA